MSNFNPFEEKPMPIDKTFMDWRMMNPKSYHKQETDPYTKTRIILMNGTEFEAQWFSRNFSRHCNNNDLRRELALVRRIVHDHGGKLRHVLGLDAVVEFTVNVSRNVR